MLEPKQLPDVRREMLEYLDDPKLFEWEATRMHPKLPNHSQRDWESYFLVTCIDMLLNAELYYATPDMCQLAQNAVNTLLPTSINAEDLPSRSGLLYSEEVGCSFLWGVFDGTLTVAPLLNRDALLTYAIERGDLTNENAKILRRLQPRLVYGAPVVWSLGQEIFQPNPNNLQAYSVWVFFITAMRLMNQKELTCTERVEAPKSIRQSIQRAGLRADPVHVVRVGNPLS